MNARNPLDSNIEYLEATGCSWLFYHPAFESQVPEIQRRVPSLARAVCIGESHTAAVSLAALAKEGHAALPDIPDDPQRRHRRAGRQMGRIRQGGD